MSFSINTNNGALLLPSLEEPGSPRAKLPPIDSLRYAPEYEREALRRLSVKEILQLTQETAATPEPQPHAFPWRPSFTHELSSREPSFPRPVTRPSSIVSSSSSSSSFSSTASEGLYSSYKRTSTTSDVFSRASSVASLSSESSACDCEPPISELESQAVQSLSRSMIPVSALLTEQSPKYVPIQPAVAALPSKPRKTTRPRSRRVQKHITGKSTRQRVGPSCDLCRAKKIKCDAYIEVVETDVDEEGVDCDSQSAVQDDALVARFLSASEVEDGFKLLLANSKLIKFRNCSFCQAKGLEATYKRGYTKEDTVLHSVLDTMNTKKEKKKLL